MKKRALFSCFVVAVSMSGVFALEPNSIKTTVYNVDGSNNTIVATSYTDGLGRPIQEKLQLPPDQSATPPVRKDRVSCTFYDDAGRPHKTTKSFVDLQYTGSFLPGERTDPTIADQLSASNHNDTMHSLKLYTGTILLADLKR